MLVLLCQSVNETAPWSVRQGMPLFTNFDSGRGLDTIVLGTSLRPHGAPCSPVCSHNRRISRRLAPSSVPTAAILYFFLALDTPVDKLCFPFQFKFASLWAMILWTIQLCDRASVASPFGVFSGQPVALAVAASFGHACSLSPSLPPAGQPVGTWRQRGQPHLFRRMARPAWADQELVLHAGRRGEQSPQEGEGGKVEGEERERDSAAPTFRRCFFGVLCVFWGDWGKL